MYSLTVTRVEKSHDPEGGARVVSLTPCCVCCCRSSQTNARAGDVLERTVAARSEQSEEVKSLGRMVRRLHLDVGALKTAAEDEHRVAVRVVADRDCARRFLVESKNAVRDVEHAAAATLASAETAVATLSSRTHRLETNLRRLASHLGEARERIDTVAIGVDGALRALDQKSEGAFAALRAMKITARAVAANVSRVAQHVGLDNVGDTPRTGAVFQIRSDTFQPTSSPLADEDTTHRVRAAPVLAKKHGYGDGDGDGDGDRFGDRYDDDACALLPFREGFTVYVPSAFAPIET